MRNSIFGMLNISKGKREIFSSSSLRNLKFLAKRTFIAKGSFSKTQIRLKWHQEQLGYCGNHIKTRTLLSNQGLRPCSLFCRRVSSLKGQDAIKLENMTHDPTSFRRLIQRFKNLEKKSFSDDIEDIVNESRALVSIFMNITTLPNLKESMVENLNTILNLYDIHERDSDFDDLSAKMKSLCLANEATYFLIIRNEMKKKDKTWKDGLKIVEIMKATGIALHARTYHHLILNAVKLGYLTDAILLLEEMKKIEINFSDEFYGLLVDAAMMNREHTKIFVLKMFSLLSDTGFILGPKAFGSIKKWFESDRKKTWKVGTSLVNLRGTCKCCSSQLKPFTLPTERRLLLQGKLNEIAEKSICSADRKLAPSKLPDFNSSNGKDPKSKIDQFKHFMHNHGPFDIALDVLNVAYYRDRGFNSFQVKRVVRHFSSRRKRVLALCSSPLVSSLLDSEEATPDLPNYHMIQLLHYLRRQGCGIFFVDDKKEDGHIDDFFVLLSMVYQEMNIDIVTADKFGDHIHSLDAISKQDFQRWMRWHQIILTRFSEKGEPLFRRRENYDIDVQDSNNDWHFPGPNRQWLCCSTKSPK